MACHLAPCLLLGRTSLLHVISVVLTAAAKQICDAQMDKSWSAQASRPYDPYLTPKGEEQVP